MRRPNINQPKIGADYFELDESERQSRLKKACQKHSPNKNDRVSRRGGYFHIPITDHYKDKRLRFSETKRIIRGEVYRQMPNVDADFAVKAREIFAREYKIHLMPQGACVVAVLVEILKAMKADAELCNKISQMKVISGPQENDDEVFPNIVIYPAMDAEAAQYVLQKLYETLHEYSNMGDGLHPRYSQKINSLIYYTQSSGDFKDRLQDSLTSCGKGPEENPIFEPDFIHCQGGTRLSVNESDTPTSTASVNSWLYSFARKFRIPFRWRP